MRWIAAVWGTHGNCDLANCATREGAEQEAAWFRASRSHYRLVATAQGADGAWTMEMAEPHTDERYWLGVWQRPEVQE